MEEEEVTYQKEAKAMSKEIRKLEKEGLRLHKQRKRDVGVFREHLVQLTQKLDGLTMLHGGHSRGLLRDCQDTSMRIVDCSAGLVRAEVDIFEALARKGWSGGGLDELLEKGRDLFANELDTVSDPHAQNAHGTKIFSILPQNRSILATDESGSGGGRPGHNRNDSLLPDGITYQSLAGAVSTGRDADVASIFSESDNRMNTSGILNRSRGVRPFSPPPMERVRSPGPLEDGKRSEPRRTPDQQRSENRSGDQQDDEERMGDQKSARTVVHTSTLEEVEGVNEGKEGERRREESEDSFFSAPAVDDTRRGGSVETESIEDRNERRERQRRWSVTDDGVVSD